MALMANRQAVAAQEKSIGMLNQTVTGDFMSRASSSGCEPC